MSQNSNVTVDVVDASKNTCVATFDGLSQACESQVTAAIWISDEEKEYLYQESKKKLEIEVQLENEQRQRELGMQPPIG
jgi:hypothetical protein